MKFTTIREGFVSKREPGSATAVAAGPRCAVTGDGQVLCTFLVQSKLGVNDFLPVLSRSHDSGVTWEEAQPIWPHLASRWSIFCSISRAPGGELFLYGMRIPIDHPGESFWSEETQGIKANELIWAHSADGGQNWTEPQVIPMPIAGAAEAPGAMCITRGGRCITA